MESTLSIQGITKQYHEHTVLDQLSLDIQAGERVAIVGPSGSGKSTLLNILTRVVTPSAGSVLVGNRPIEAYRDNKEYARKIGILRQQFDLIRQLSVVHNVLAGRFNEWGLMKSLFSLFVMQDRHIAQKALDQVGLGHKMHELAANLSGGEQQRVAIARLLVQNPEIILADEPVSSLDPANARRTLQLLIELVEMQDKTLIASMHSVDLSREFFTRMIGLRDGRILFDCPMAEVEDTMLEALYGGITDERHV